MNDQAKVKALQEKVEKIGVSIEKFGRTPIEGRVFAYLLLSNPPYRSFDDIVEFLSAGKSSVSNALNMYLKEGTLTYRTFSGDRKRYFMIDVDGWKKGFEKSMTSFNLLLEDVLEYRSTSNSKEFNSDLRKLFDFQTHLNTEIVKAIDKWNKT